MKKLLLLLSVTFMVGCTGINIQSVFNSLPQVQELLAEHPEANFIFTYWTASEINETIDDISVQCEKNMAVQDMYFARVSEGNVEVSAWFDTNYNPLCVVRKDSPEEVFDGNETPSDDHEECDECYDDYEWNGELVLKMDEIENGACVKLKWTPYPWTNLKYYKVVRSTTNSNPRYPDDGFIKAIHSRLDNTLIDCPEESGKYYYGVTTVLTDDEKHYTNPVDAEIEALDVNEEFVLEYAIKEEGECVKLEWTPYPWSDFKYYKVVRSSTNSDPKYPKDNYINVITSKSQNSVINCPPETGLYYYGITMMASDGEKHYTNPVKVYIEKHEYYTCDNIILEYFFVEEGECVKLDWYPYPWDDLKYYKVVRSTTNSNPRYPDDGHIAAISGKYDTGYIDCPPEQGTYYYGVTMVSNSDEKCYTHPVTVEFDWEELIDFDVELTGEIVEEGECVRLEWLAWPQSIIYYKVVKSTTNSDPKYPEDGYLECIENRQDTVYYDCDLGNESPIYYRITTVRTDYSKAHSNVITIDNSSP